MAEDINPLMHARKLCGKYLPSIFCPTSSAHEDPFVSGNCYNLRTQFSASQLLQCRHTQEDAEKLQSTFLWSISSEDCHAHHLKYKWTLHQEETLWTEGVAAWTARRGMQFSLHVVFGLQDWRCNTKSVKTFQYCTDSRKNNRHIHKRNNHVINWI